MKHNFTLVELLVTVGIIAILAGLVIPAVISSQNQGRITQAKSDMNAIKLALKSVETTYGSIKYDSVTPDTNGIALIGSSDYDKFMAELYAPQKVSTIKFNKRKIKFLCKFFNGLKF